MAYAYFLGMFSLSILLVALSSLIEIMRGVDPVPMPPDLPPDAQRLMPYLLPLFWIVLAIVTAFAALSYARNTTTHRGSPDDSWVSVVAGMGFILSGIIAVVRSLRKQARQQVNPPKSQLNGSHAGQ